MPRPGTLGTVPVSPALARQAGLPAPGVPVSTALGRQEGPVRVWDYKGVAFTVGKMRELVRKALVREKAMPVRRLAEEIIAGVHAKDYTSEVAAIYFYVLTNLRYVRDPAHIELVQSPLQVLQPTAADRAAGRRAAQEDCETIATTLAALLMVIGNKCEFVTITTNRQMGFHHVFLVAHLPDGRRVVCDPVPGPEATEMLRATVRHQVWPIEPVRDAGGGMLGGDETLVAPAPAFEGPGPGALQGAPWLEAA